MTANRRIQMNFDRAAAQYDRYAELQKLQVRRILDHATEWLPRSAVIADIGCGTGYFGAIARRVRPDWRVTGIDYAFAMTQEARPRCANVLQANATQLPLVDGSVDAVVSSLCLQWVPDKLAAIKEMKRIVKPGGHVIITSFGKETLRELRQSISRTATTLGLLAMPSFAEWSALAEQSDMQVMVCQRTLEHRQYASLEALLDSMRKIGAGNAVPTKEPLTASKFTRLSQRYEADFGSAKGIPATWETIFLALKNA